MQSAILVVHVVGVVVLIWAFYGFRYATFAAGAPGLDQQFLGETIDTLIDGKPVRPVIILARDLRVLPEAYQFGLAHVLNRSGRFVGFLNGRYSLEGWWQFFPYCWLVKTPPPRFGLLGLATFGALQRLRGSQDLPGLKKWLERPQSQSGSRPVYVSYIGSGNPAQYGIEARQIYSRQDWRRDRPLYELTEGIYCTSATMLQSVYTQAPGPWAVPYEAAYRRARLEIERYQTLKSDPAHAGVLTDLEIAAWRRLVSDFDQLRLARLCAYLRRREPDAQVGYSILIFRLSDEEVRDALNGAPAELLPEVGVEGLSWDARSLDGCSNSQSRRHED